MTPFLWKAIIGFIILVLLVLFIVFVLGVDVSGPLGDTFGGLSSPIIGFVSIYLIYRTFKAQQQQLEDQREQLNDQKAANLNERSAVLLTEMKQILDETLRRFQNISFTVIAPVEHTITVVYGTEAFDAFQHEHRNITGKMGFDGVVNRMLFMLNEQLSDLEYVASSAANLFLTLEHKNFIEMRLKKIIRFYLPYSEMMYSSVDFLFEQIKGKTFDSLQSTSVNSTLEYAQNYRLIMEAFKQFGYVEERSSIMVNEYPVEAVKLNLLNEFKPNKRYYIPNK